MTPGDFKENKEDIVIPRVYLSLIFKECGLYTWAGYTTLIMV